VLGLFGGLLLCVQRKANHQRHDPPLAYQLAQLFQVGGITAASQGRKGRHGEA
jgi:hypothetical protein